MINLSKDQETAISDLLEWYSHDRHDKKYITLGGYAGTGKTTLITVLRKELKKITPKLKVGFVSFTGKASRVLQSKLKENKAIIDKDTVSTIHSLIYSPICNERDEIIGWQLKEKIERDLIIIDEASMVDKNIWNHLLSYKVPIIAIGDHGQLPPINDNFNLMEDPDLRLEQIHRQARDNPIIQISIQARENGQIKSGEYGKKIIKFTKDNYDLQSTLEEILANYQQDTLVLCGYNSTRKKLNNYIRQSLGFYKDFPMITDRVICLRNNHKKSIFNGMLGSIRSISSRDENWYLAEISMDGEEDVFTGLISVKQFNSDTSLNFTQKRREILQGDLFDFGYALTVHKAQGSQSRKVILFEEKFAKMNDSERQRWLYTAVTRATEELFIFPARI
jgi:exodeoxyribonuclease-5